MIYFKKNNTNKKDLLAQEYDTINQITTTIFL